MSIKPETSAAESLQNCDSLFDRPLKSGNHHRHKSLISLLNQKQSRNRHFHGITTQKARLGGIKPGFFCCSDSSFASSMNYKALKTAVVNGSFSSFHADSDGDIPLLGMRRANVKNCDSLYNRLCQYQSAIHA
jgi:hypothetical protein